MKRIIKGFQADWIGNHKFELVRTTEPMHRYVYEASPDERRLKRRELTTPADIPAGESPCRCGTVIAAKSSLTLGAEVFPTSCPDATRARIIVLKYFWEPNLTG